MYIFLFHLLDIFHTFYYTENTIFYNVILSDSVLMSGPQLMWPGDAAKVTRVTPQVTSVT